MYRPRPKDRGITAYGLFLVIMGTEEIVLSDEDLEDLNWEEQDGITYAEFEHRGKRFRVSVQGDNASCKGCDSSFKSTGEFRIRRVGDYCLASTIRAAKLPIIGCGGSSMDTPTSVYKVIQIGLVGSNFVSLVGPVQPSLF